MSKKINIEKLRESNLFPDEYIEQYDLDCEEILEKEIEIEKKQMIKSIEDCRKIGVSYAIIENALISRSLGYLRMHYAMDDPRWFRID